MTDKFSQVLTELEASGNFRKIPDEATGELVDLSSNDYMGIAADKVETFSQTHEQSGNHRRYG